MLCMLVEGMHTRTRRQRQVSGGQVFTSDLGTGHTSIYIRGSLSANSMGLIAIMNEIHEKLKKQFWHVATIN